MGPYFLQDKITTSILIESGLNSSHPRSTVIPPSRPLQLLETAHRPRLHSRPRPTQPSLACTVRRRRGSIRSERRGLSDETKIWEIRVVGRAVIREGGVCSRSLVRCSSMMVNRLFFLFEQAADIVQLILDHGKLRPPDIISQMPIFLDAKGA